MSLKPTEAGSYCYQKAKIIPSVPGGGGWGPVRSGMASMVT